jgi:hypothetical protein
VSKLGLSIELDFKDCAAGVHLFGPGFCAVELQAIRFIPEGLRSE